MTTVYRRSVFPLVFVVLLAVVPAVGARTPDVAPSRTARALGEPAAVGGEDPPRLHVEGDRLVDDLGRTVLLRGVNVNQLAEYWEGTAFPATFPLPESDFDLIASFGWNAVRLLVSWSRVEPEPGVYDEAYLDAVAQAARWAGERGIYVVVDLHQDAWGPHLAARDDETCLPGTTPAIGWDGAPQWATLDDGLPRCYLQLREVNHAVAQSFQSFWLDRPAADGVGIQTRYLAMLGHLAERFTQPWIVGFDLMNEPNPGYLVGANDLTLLHAFYARAVDAIRRAEAAVDAAPHVVFFEPGAQWSALSTSPAPPFTLDGNVVFAPHIYTGSLGPGEVEMGFASADREAQLYGDVPVLVGEWGADPRRAGPDGDGYFVRHQDLQDRYLFSATMWTWRESCGDPHLAQSVLAGGNPSPWGLFDVDCRTNGIEGMRMTMRDELLRAYARAAPGLEAAHYAESTGVFAASGRSPGSDAPVELVYPAAKHGMTAEDVVPTVFNLTDVTVEPGPGDDLVTIRASAGDLDGTWFLSVVPRS